MNITSKGCDFVDANYWWDWQKLLDCEITDIFIHGENVIQKKQQAFIDKNVASCMLLAIAVLAGEVAFLYICITFKYLSKQWFSENMILGCSLTCSINILMLAH